MAIARFSTMHRARDHSGEPCLVRRCVPGHAKGYAGAYAELHGLDELGFVVPAAVGLDQHDVWITACPWSREQCAPAVALDDYVAGFFTGLLRYAIIVGTGHPHVTPDGRIVCEDVTIASRLENYQCHLLRDVVLGLVTNRPHQVVECAAALCGGWTMPGLIDAARQSCLSLSTSWSPVALGISLTQLTATTSKSGTRNDVLALVSDEFLHRLDLAHANRCALRSLRRSIWIERIIDDRNDSSPGRV